MPVCPYIGQVFFVNAFRKLEKFWNGSALELLKSAAARVPPLSKRFARTLSAVLFLDQKHRRSAVRIGVLQFAPNFKAEPWENPIQQPPCLKNLSWHLPATRLSAGRVIHDSTQDGSGNRSRFSELSIPQSQPKPAPIIPPVMYF